MTPDNGQDKCLRKSNWLVQFTKCDANKALQEKLPKCYAMQCFAVLCSAVHAVQLCAELISAMQRFAALHSARHGCAALCSARQFCAALSSKMKCYAVLCRVNNILRVTSIFPNKQVVSDATWT